MIYAQKTSSYNALQWPSIYMGVILYPVFGTSHYSDSYMEIEPDRIETTVRLLQNGRYVWTITLNTEQGKDNQEIATRLKQLDGTLADAFPNHVKVSSFKVSEFSEE